MTKVTSTIGLAALGLLGMGFFAYRYYEVNLLPPLSQASLTYENMLDQERSIPFDLKDIIYRTDASYRGDGTLPKDIRFFIVERMASDVKTADNEVSWQLQTLLLSYLISRRFSEAQLVSLYCYYLSFGALSGLQGAANYYYGSGLDDLGIDETMTLLAMSKLSNPSISREELSDSQKLKKIKEILYARYNAGP